MPLCFGRSGSVRAISMPRLQSCAVEVHTFCPVMIHSSPSLIAFVCRPGEVGAGAGLGEQLAPRVLPVEDAQQVFLLLALVAVRGDRRRGEQVAEAGRRADRAVLGDRARSRPSRGRGPSPCPTRPRGTSARRSRSGRGRSHHSATVRSGSQFSSSQALTSVRTSSALGRSAIVIPRRIDCAVPETAGEAYPRPEVPCADDEHRGVARVRRAPGLEPASSRVVRKDGAPHVVPVWFVLDGDDFVFTTGATTIKGKALRRDGRATICVDDDRPPFAFVTRRGTVPGQRGSRRDARLGDADRRPLHGCGPRRGVRPPQRGRRRAARAPHTDARRSPKPASPTERRTTPPSALERLDAAAFVATSRSAGGRRDHRCGPRRAR